jgi:hypothetical protein
VQSPCAALPASHCAPSSRCERALVLHPFTECSLPVLRCPASHCAPSSCCERALVLCPFTACSLPVLRCLLHTALLPHTVNVHWYCILLLRAVSLCCVALLHTVLFPHAMNVRWYCVLLLHAVFPCAALPCFTLPASPPPQHAPSLKHIPMATDTLLGVVFLCGPYYVKY